MNEQIEAYIQSILSNIKTIQNGLEDRSAGEKGIRLSELRDALAKADDILDDYGCNFSED